MAARSKKKAKPALPLATQIASRLYPYQRELFGGLLLLFTTITLLSMLSLTGGSLSQWWANVFSQLFGWWAIPAVLMLGIFGSLLLISRFKEESNLLPLDIIIGMELLFVTALGLTHLLAIEPGIYAVKLAREGGGGGFVGWGISNFFIELVGEPFAIIVLVLITLASVGIIFRVTVADAADVDDGHSIGADATFTTSYPAPIVSTGAATALSTTAASVVGTVRARNTDAQIFVDYGTNASNLSNSVTATPPIVLPVEEGRIKASGFAANSSIRVLSPKILP